jgi:hypothetical protein
MVIDISVALSNVFLPAFYHRLRARKLEAWVLRNLGKSDFEQRIEFLLRVLFRRHRPFARAQDLIGREVVAVIGSFLVAHPLGLSLGALVVSGGNVEAAVAATVKVSLAPQASVTRAHPARSSRDFKYIAALPHFSNQPSAIGRESL